MTYSEKLRDPRWQKKRLKILSRDRWRCKLCKDESTELHVHHKEYSGDPWEADDKMLMTLCKHCHSTIESMNREDVVVPLRSYKIEFESGATMVFLGCTRKIYGKSLCINIYNGRDEFKGGYILVEDDFLEIASIVQSLKKHKNG